MTRKTLFWFGVLSSLLYASMLVVVPLGWDAYSSSSQTVSELSAIDAPTRQLWVSLGLLWGGLYGTFGWLLWRSAGSGRALHAAGAVILLAAVTGLFWPPMHLRTVLAAGGGTLTDTLHLVWTAVNGVLTLLAMALAASALGGWFRAYSMVTMATLIGAGALTSMEAPGVKANLPTPMIGVWERVNIGAWLLWVLVLAVAASRLGAPRDAAPSTR